jgi:hypothetical protein
MRRPYARLATACALAVATTIFAGGALAGNGNGNENAPGQLKKAQEQQSASAQAQAGVQATASVNAGATATDSAPGVKPDNSTSKWTQCTTGGTPAAATCTAIAPTPNTKPDVSKRYGNGKTAAQIAVGRGASAVKLTGPGNSQPHKVSDCRHKANRSGGVDVHAVKSYSATCQAATTTASTQATTQVTSQAAASVQSTASVQETAAAAQQSSTPAAQSSAAAAQGTPAAQAGVLGAQTTLSSPKSSNGSVQGTALPFTGFPLWPAVLIGLSLLGAGLTVRRRSAAPRL